MLTLFKFLTLAFIFSSEIRLRTASFLSYTNVKDNFLDFHHADWEIINFVLTVGAYIRQEVWIKAWKVSFLLNIQEKVNKWLGAIFFYIYKWIWTAVYLWPTTEEVDLRTIISAPPTQKTERSCDFWMIEQSQLSKHKLPLSWHAYCP